MHVDGKLARLENDNKNTAIFVVKTHTFFMIIVMFRYCYITQGTT